MPSVMGLGFRTKDLHEFLSHAGVCLFQGHLEGTFPALSPSKGRPPATRGDPGASRRASGERARHSHEAWGPFLTAGFRHMPSLSPGWEGGIQSQRDVLELGFTSLLCSEGVVIPSLWHWWERKRGEIQGNSLALGLAHSKNAFRSLELLLLMPLMLCLFTGIWKHKKYFIKA